LVEQKTLNLFVEGSNPSGGTKQTQGFAVNWGNSQKTILATSWTFSRFRRGLIARACVEESALSLPFG